MNKEILIKVPTSEHINDISKDYALYVAENRAIPKVMDGLKAAQRKALYLMMKRAGEIKTISLAGMMISENLYLHGDTSAADTISLLAAPYCNNLPWLTGIGTFGTKVNPKGYSAPRYTYVKRSKSADEIMLVDRDIIPMEENYDGSTMEPTTFLPIIPAVLLNGVSGIAVGWSTEILPRSLDDLIKATVAAIDGKKIKPLPPKFDYINCDVEALDTNQWEFKGKIRIDNTTTVTVIELPPELSLEKFKDKLIQLEDSKTIQGFTDNSSDHIDIEIKFRREDLKNLTPEKIISLLKLTTRKTERIVTVDWDNKSIRQFTSAEEVVQEFVNHRFDFYVKRFQKLLADDEYELRYWKGVKLCFDGDLPKSLRSFKNKQEVEKKIDVITKSVGLDKSQIDRIAGTPSYNWAKDRYAVVQNKIKELEKQTEYYRHLLSNHGDIRNIFKQEVLSLGKIKFDLER